MSTAVSKKNPVTFRLPPPGEVDPFFGLNRSFYYTGEERGYWKLVRILDDEIRDKPRKKIDALGRERKQRGRTLVPFDAVLKFLQREIEKQNKEAS